MKIESVIKENPQAPKKRSLSPHDRCDSCGAQALVRYAMRQGDLLFCGHHAGRNHEVLISQGAVISEDDREVLLAEESGSSHSIK